MEGDNHEGAKRERENNYLEISTVYKRIPLFELDFFVVQK